MFSILQQQQVQAACVATTRTAFPANALVINLAWRTESVPTAAVCLAPAACATTSAVVTQSVSAAFVVLASAAVYPSNATKNKINLPAATVQNIKSANREAAAVRNTTECEGKASASTAARAIPL